MTAATFEERLHAIEAQLAAKVADSELRANEAERQRDEYKKLVAFASGAKRTAQTRLAWPKGRAVPKNVALLNLALGGDAAAPEVLNSTRCPSAGPSVWRMSRNATCDNTCLFEARGHCFASGRFISPCDRVERTWDGTLSSAVEFDFLKDLVA